MHHSSTTRPTATVQATTTNHGSMDEVPSASDERGGVILGLQQRGGVILGLLRRGGVILVLVAQGE
jgi:hypothetical protein